MKILIQKTRNKAEESQTGKGKVSKASLTCIVRGGVQIWEERKGRPNIWSDASGSVVCSIREPHVLSGSHGYWKHNTRAQPEKKKKKKKHGSSTGRVVGLQAGDRASTGWEAQKADGCPFFIRNGRETILMLVPGQLATADSASW